MPLNGSGSFLLLFFFALKVPSRGKALAGVGKRLTAIKIKVFVNICAGTQTIPN